MSKRWMTVLLVVVFLLGLCILLYPSVANYVNERNQTRAITEMNNEAEKMQQEQRDSMIAAAQAFNDKLYASGGLHVLSEEENEEYLSLLNLLNDSVIGSVSIPKINVQLAIAHTVEEDVLQRYCGHLPGSSFPVEGVNVHAVLSAHRGLPSAELFSNLDQLALGDTFTVSVLDRIYTYQVDDITVILPEETEALSIIPGGNYTTLMTCTPYGVNTHRLLVRGELVNVLNTSEATGEETETELAPFYVRYRNELILGAAGILVIIFLVLLLRRKGSTK